MEYSIDYFKSLGWFEGTLLLMAGLFLGGFISYGISWVVTPYGQPFERRAKVKVLSYSPSHSNTGVGVSGSGQPVVTSNYESEHYSVVLSLDNGNTWKIEHENLFNDVEQGMLLNLKIRSKKVWGEDLWDLVSWEKI